MITLASGQPKSASSHFSRSALALAIAAGVTLALAGCGKGQQGPATSAATSAKPAASAPAASGPAALPSASSQAAAASAAQAAAKAQAKLASMSVPDLLTAARTAYAAHKLVAPAGDNAMEYYEAVLAKDPKNQVAKDALRETFPFGVPDVEKAIAANNFDEATREIGVLAKADPTNYTLTLLRSKLDAQQKLQARQQQQAQQQAQRATEAAAAQKAAAAKAAADKEAAAKLAAQQAASARVAAPVAARPAPAAAKPTTGITRNATVVQAAAASYPIAAARNQTSGFAVVQFTVTASGAVTGAHIISSQPRRVFDQAA
ncbi:MAG TPA: energy transducer TonB, partial [Rhodanobacteraceae bacterium]